MDRVDRALERSLNGAGGGREAGLGVGTVGIGLALAALGGVNVFSLVFVAVPVLALCAAARLATRRLGHLDAAGFVLVFAGLATLANWPLLTPFTTLMGGPDGFMPIVWDGRVTLAGWAWTFIEMTIVGGVLIILRILLGLCRAGPPAPSPPAPS